MEVNFHMPGLRGNYPLNVTFIRLQQDHPEFFREGVTFASCYGEFPPSLWAGGRNSKPDMCDEKFINTCIKMLNGYGVSVRFAFTNKLLEESDMSDPYCNYCLQAAHNGMNGVILVSPILEEYVRKNYPKMKIISSTCKEIRGIDGVNEELKKPYDLVVLDYNLNNHFDELEKITDKGRCEILVNAQCQPNCPARGAHYNNISANQKIIARSLRAGINEPVPLEPWTYKGCKGGRNLYAITNLPTYVSPEAIWEKYVPMGFRNFKLEGRNDHIFSVLEVFCHYLIKPEYQGKVRFMMLERLEQLKIIQINMP